MVKKENIVDFMNKMLPQWQESVGYQGLPSTIYYFRDGISEGQFGMAIETEVQALKECSGPSIPRTPFRSRRSSSSRPPSATTSVCSLLVIAIRTTTPTWAPSLKTRPTFQWDFYLNSHSAIQGIARPVHYHVLLDENKCNPGQLEAMIYSQCYQYARSTTPVFLHPVIHYADIVVARARGQGGHRRHLGG
jgi:eukaryotic translation initiation factor 2C